MIARIVVGSGSGRTVIAMPRSRDTRRELSGKLKHNFFPTNRAYGSAKRRGALALAGGF